MSPILFAADEITEAISGLPEEATTYERVGCIAARQHGVISRGQIRTLDLDDRWIERQLAAGYLHR